MGGNAMTTDFLKECMADSLLKLMQKKEFSKITINEIAQEAGVNRSTWFRNFTTKNEALTFKLVHAWERWAREHALTAIPLYTLEHAREFFQFNYENRTAVNIICQAELHSVIYAAFYQVMMPQFGADPMERYERRFYANGMFGLLDEWRKRDYQETPEEMTQLFLHIIHP